MPLIFISRQTTCDMHTRVMMGVGGLPSCACMIFCCVAFPHHIVFIGPTSGDDNTCDFVLVVISRVPGLVPRHENPIMTLIGYTWQ